MALPSLVAPEYETIIPSTKQTIKYRPFLVKEEKILYLAMESGEEKEILHALMNLLKSCILDEVDTNVLTTYDLEYLFLNIRAKSVNDVINLNVKHQDQETCDGVTKIEITISDVNISHDENHVYNLVLDEKTGLGLELKDPAALDLGEVVDTKDEFDAVFGMVHKCVKLVFDEHNVYDNFTEEELKQNILDNLNQEQFEKLMSFFNTLPALKHEVEYTCSKCKEKETVVIEGLHSFFT
jgi:hypothetical protein